MRGLLPCPGKLHKEEKPAKTASGWHSGGRNTGRGDIFFVASSAGAGTIFLNYSSGLSGRGLVGFVLARGPATGCVLDRRLTDGTNPWFAWNEALEAAVFERGVIGRPHGELFSGTITC